MPKIKTNSGAKKLTKKTKKQKRNLCHSTLVDGANIRQVKELLVIR